MTTAANTTTQKNVTNVRLFVLFVLVMLSSTGMFAQSATATIAPATVSTEVSSVSKDSAIVVTTEKSVAASMDFAVWFMGSKKTNNNSNNASFSKKQLINSGINTNSVLIRSFLKKVSTQESAIA